MREPVERRDDSAKWTADAEESDQHRQSDAGDDRDRRHDAHHDNAVLLVVFRGRGRGRDETVQLFGETDEFGIEAFLFAFKCDGELLGRRNVPVPDVVDDGLNVVVVGLVLGLDRLQLAKHIRVFGTLVVRRRDIDAFPGDLLCLENFRVDLGGQRNQVFRQGIQLAHG